MLEILIITLFLLWVLGYVNFEGLNVPDIVLFQINGQNITLWNIFTVAVIAWIIGLLSSPFREIASVFLVIRILSLLGIIAIAGLPSALLISMIVGLIFYLFSFRTHSHD